MPYEIAALHDQMPKGRIRQPKTDKYQEHKELLDQIPEGKTAQIPVEKSAYRAFSAGLRAAGVQVGKKAEAAYKGGHAWVSWLMLTEGNKPKRRGGRRKQTEEAVAPAPAPIEEAPVKKSPGRPRKAAASA